MVADNPHDFKALVDHQWQASEPVHQKHPATDLTERTLRAAAFRLNPLMLELSLGRPVSERFMAVA
jgi:hypothetical protein